ncbi:hypothetical protein [Streptomyces sp. H27-C3]|uniref:hypothetical protein n=1 Tax=Streptomyces sp. H27-C3 TaxID=3046305 RepID=UPI0024B946E5|nr:hypothetical protein [Streptomyces sp. H27-C3]MDJ0461927.1 hypothetical protein [Streptomyces sp. H27-C3]
MARRSVARDRTAIGVPGIPYILVMPLLRYRMHRWEAGDTAVYSRTGWIPGPTGSCPRGNRPPGGLVAHPRWAARRYVFARRGFFVRRTAVNGWRTGTGAVNMAG